MIVRLRRSDCSGKGIARRRAGRGFIYMDASGERITDPDLIERIKSLVIPPAWQEVWICPHLNGHIQATGFDEAGRKQYLYHEDWSRTRAAMKFDHVLDFARALPRLRRAVASRLDPVSANRECVLAAGIRLMDLGHFRVGSEQYAAENESYGLATLKRSHVSLGDLKDEVVFEYSGKSSQEQIHVLRDTRVRELSELLLRRRSGSEDFLVYREGRQWVDVTAEDLRGFIQEQIGPEFSAKDFRTWNGTVIAAISLASQGGPAQSARAREKQIVAAVKEVAEELGNTPAVARSSYIDPRLLDRFRDGKTIKWAPGARRWSSKGLSAVERRVLELISD